jgi:hypothetical protein
MWCLQLSHLLWAEELQHEVEVQQYDMNNQRLDTDRFRRFFRLRVSDQTMRWPLQLMQHA